MICPGCEHAFSPAEVADCFDGSLCCECEEKLVKDAGGWCVNNDNEDEL